MSTDLRIRGAGWIHDPTRRHQIRYWDGRRWTERVSDNGRRSVDVIDEQPPAPLVPTVEPRAHDTFWPTLPAVCETIFRVTHPTVSAELR